MRDRRPIPAAIRTRLDHELARAPRANDPWPHLERAHILSQPWAGPHTRVHWTMLTVAARQRDRRELLGQLVRLIVAGPGSLTGRYPPGNTGRTTMGLTETAPLPTDLADILNAGDHN